MSGYAHEWVEAKKENVKASWRSQPVSYQADGGKLTGLVCRQMDENKQEIEGSEFSIPADLVLLAIGQGKQGELTPRSPVWKSNGGRSLSMKMAPQVVQECTLVETVSTAEKKS